MIKCSVSVYKTIYKDKFYPIFLFIRIKKITTKQESKLFHSIAYLDLNKRKYCNSSSKFKYHRSRQYSMPKNIYTFLL